MTLTKSKDKGVHGHLPIYFCKWVSRFLKKTTYNALAEVTGKTLIKVLCWESKFHGNINFLEMKHQLNG